LQAWRCNQCGYRFTRRYARGAYWQRLYLQWLFKRRTLQDICLHAEISLPTLSKHFDVLRWPDGLLCTTPAHAINLMADATFFGRDYGYLCFHDTHRIIWFREIKTEGVRHFRQGLYELKEAGFRFKSITIDGRAGYYNAIRKLLGGVPIQMCLFHQQAIVRRYVTDKPKSLCGQELKDLMKSLGSAEPSDFIDRFYRLFHKHRGFLEERNWKREHKHQALRSAFKSLQTNMPQLFTYKDIPYLNIPPTINHLEGAFSHLKEKINIHRGLNQQRKKNAIKAFFNSHPFL
jgi:hypothetical protein